MSDFPRRPDGYGSVEWIGGDMPPVTFYESLLLLRSRWLDLLAALLPWGAVGDLLDDVAQDAAVDYIREWGRNVDLHYPDDTATDQPTEATCPHGSVITDGACYECCPFGDGSGNAPECGHDDCPEHSREQPLPDAGGDP